jgi:hypothetical protein
VGDGEGAQTHLRPRTPCIELTKKEKRWEEDKEKKKKKRGLEGRSEMSPLRLAVVGTLKGYSKVLEYEYRVKIVALGTLKQYSIFSLTLYLERYSAYSIVDSGGPTS